jgi:hypothetical protein
MTKCQNIHLNKFLRFKEVKSNTFETPFFIGQNIGYEKMVLLRYFLQNSLKRFSMTCPFLDLLRQQLLIDNVFFFFFFLKFISNNSMFLSMIPNTLTVDDITPSNLIYFK